MPTFNKEFFANLSIIHWLGIALLFLPIALIVSSFDSEEEKAAKAAEESRIRAETAAENIIIDLMTFAQLQIKNKLKDSESAKFANVYVSTTDFVCGEVNSKNSFGGYAGYQRFISAYPANITALEEHTSEREFKKSWAKFCIFKTTTEYAKREHSL